MEVDEIVSTEMQGSSPTGTSTSSNGDGKDRRMAGNTTTKNGGDTSMNVIEIDSGRYTVHWQLTVVQLTPLAG